PHTCPVSTLTPLSLHAVISLLPPAPATPKCPLFPYTTLFRSQEAQVFGEAKILVEKAAGEVCQRCRQMKNSIGTDKELPTLCAHCAEIVKEENPEAVSEGIE